MLLRRSESGHTQMSNIASAGQVLVEEALKSIYEISLSSTLKQLHSYGLEATGHISHTFYITLMPLCLDAIDFKFFTPCILFS